MPPIPSTVITNPDDEYKIIITRYNQWLKDIETSLDIPESDITIENAKKDPQGLWEEIQIQIISLKNDEEFFITTYSLDDQIKIGASIGTDRDLHDIVIPIGKPGRYFLRVLMGSQKYQRLKDHVDPGNFTDVYVNKTPFLDDKTIISAENKSNQIIAAGRFHSPIAGGVVLNILPREQVFDGDEQSI